MGQLVMSRSIFPQILRENRSLKIDRLFLLNETIKTFVHYFIFWHHKNYWFYHYLKKKQNEEFCLTTQKLWEK